MASRRAQAYAARIPAAVSGAGGHDQTFSAAVALVHGFGLTESDAWPILLEYNRRCTPPWSEAELRHKLTSATQLTHHSRERGYLLTTPSPGTRFARQRNDTSPFPADHQIAPPDATRSPFPDVEARNRASVPNFDLRGRLGQVRLRDLPEIPESTPKRETAKEREDTSQEQGPESPPRFAPTGATRHSCPSIESASARLFPTPNSVPPDASPAIPDPPSSIPSSPTSTPETGPFARLRRGPTIQLPRAINGSLQGFIDPRTDPERQWIHIQGYMSIPPKNCPICWLQRGRSLWIGACICTSEISILNGFSEKARKGLSNA